MRIGIFTDDYLPRKSGVVASILALKQGLTAQGHEVFVIAPNYPGYKDGDPAVVRLPSMPVMLQVRLVIAYPGMLRRLDGLKLDVIHSQTELSMGLLAIAASKRYGIPHVRTVHTIWASFLQYYPRLQVTLAVKALAWTYQLYFRQRLGPEPIDEQFWQLQNMFLARCDGVVVPSEHLLETLRKYHLKRPAFCIPNGVDIAAFAGAAQERRWRPSGQLRLLYVGRLSGEKRQDAVLRGLAQTNNPHIQLTLVGDGPQAAVYKKLAKELGLQRQVHFTGALDTPQIIAHMAQADVCVLASYKFDNQPVVILEAIAAGLPVLYCDPALQTGLTPENSVLTKDETPAAFAEAIHMLYQTPQDNLQKMSQASRKLSKSYDIKHFATHMLAAYRKVLDN